MTKTYVLFECSCGYWGRWQDQRRHHEACGRASRLAYTEVVALFAVASLNDRGPAEARPLPARRLGEA